MVVPFGPNLSSTPGDRVLVRHFCARLFNGEHDGSPEDGDRDELRPEQPAGLSGTVSTIATTNATANSVSV